MSGDYPRIHAPAKGRSAIFGEPGKVETWVFRLQDLSIDIPLLPMLKSAPDDVLRKIYDFAVQELKRRGSKL